MPPEGSSHEEKPPVYAEAMEPSVRPNAEISSKRTREKKYVTAPPPRCPAPPPTRPIGPRASPLLSAAPRHQVDGLFQFVPQFVFATVPVTVQGGQDLRKTGKGGGAFRHDVKRLADAILEAKGLFFWEQVSPLPCTC